MKVSNARSEFLSVLAHASLALPFASLPDVTEFELPLDSPKEYQQLYEYGLEQYTGILKQTRQTESLFGGSSSLWERVTQTLKNSAEGKIASDDPSVKVLNEGWYTQNDLALAHAKENIESLVIDVSTASDGVTESEVREFLRKGYPFFPIISIAMPKKVEVWNDGGVYRSSGSIAITSPRNKKSAPVTYLHEGTHATDYQWERFKPYLFQNDFIQYVGFYMKYTYEIALDWLDNRNPLSYFEKVPFIKIFNDNQNISQYYDLAVEMSNIGRICGVAVKNLEEKPESITSEMLVKNWNTLVYAVGKTLQFEGNTKRTEYIGKHKAELEKLFVYGIRSQYDASGESAYLPGLLSQIEHFLTGPIQKRGGGLPVNRSDFGNDFILQCTLELQKKRLALYSTISPSTSLMKFASVFGSN